MLIGLEALTGLLFAATGAMLWRAFRVARSPSLRNLAVGFFLLALSLAPAIGLEKLTQDDPEFATEVWDHLDLLFWAYYATFAAGCVFVFLSFGRRPFQLTAAYGPVLAWAFPINQIALAALLFLVVLHAGFNHIVRARAGSLQTAMGFFLLLAGQFLFMIDLSAIRPEWFAPEWFFGTNALNPRNVVGEVASVVGAGLLFLAVARPRRAT